MSHPSCIGLVLVPFLGLAFAVGSAPAQDGSTCVAEPVCGSAADDDYRYLDNVEGTNIDLVFAPVRPMVLVGDDLYAVNAHDSTVVHYDLALNAEWFSTPWGPVSIAYWAAQDQLLVVCRGTYALARLDRATGELVDLLSLPAEPADVVIDDPTSRAFISCAAAEVVVEVDLVMNTIAAERPANWKHPFFLSHDATTNSVFVTPLFSGNNTTVDKGQNAFDPGPRGVLDLSDPSVIDSTVAGADLPDEDVFRIGLSSGTVNAVARGLGTILFAHGVNPISRELWVLNTDANNVESNAGGEPGIRGAFAENRVSILPPGGPPRFVDVGDDAVFTDGPIGQPYALAFDDADGDAWICGMLTDNVAELDSTGALVRQWNVGSIPRGLLKRPGKNQLVVYCWGSNEIEVYRLAPAEPEIYATLELGFDPTTEKRKLGRAIFYDGRRSGNGLSCATCHVDGRMDFLGWDLSNLPHDDKGVLTTQTLRNIEATLPYHWRGERRDLDAFNGAFDGLLGGTELDDDEGGELEQFKAYVFGLFDDANPNEDEERVLRWAGSGPDPICGQTLYFDKCSVGPRSCAGCHAPPLGTTHDVFRDEAAADPPERVHFKIAPFSTGAWRKQQPVDFITLQDPGPNPDDRRAMLGFGFSASGMADNLIDFFTQDNVAFDPAERENVDAFLIRFDTGLAPAVHRATLLGPSDPATAETRIATYLLPQVAARNCDLAVFGTVLIEGELAPRALRWYFDRSVGSSGAFVAEDSTVLPRDLAFFRDQADAGRRNTFVGLPVGMGRRWGVDSDRDELLNVDESVWSTDPHVADHDGDGYPDGHEVQNEGDPVDAMTGSMDSKSPLLTGPTLLWTTASVAKLRAETDEPCRLSVTYYDTDVGVPNPVFAVIDSDVFETNHTILLRDLKPGRIYAVSITARDHGNHAATSSLAGGVTTRAHFNPDGSVVSDVTAVVVDTQPTSMRIVVTAALGLKGGGLATNHAVELDVYRVTTAIVGGEHVKTYDPVAFGLLGSTSASPPGVSSLVLDVPGLTAGQLVSIGVATVVEAPEGPAPIRTTWSMPSSNPDALILEVPFSP